MNCVFLGFNNWIVKRSIILLISPRHSREQDSLVSLNLRNVWLAGKSLRNFSDSLDSKPHLTKLVVPYIATDHLVAMVGRHCPVMEFLDISGTELVTDIGVTKLYRYKVGRDMCPTDLTQTLR